MSEPIKIQPRPTATSEPYWQGCAAGELRLQFCAACTRYQFYPRIICSACGGRELEWRPSSGNGAIATFTVVRRGVSAAYEEPYVVALIDLDEGVRMMSQLHLADVDDPRLQVGARVKVAFTPWSDETTVPVFHLEDK